MNRTVKYILLILVALLPFMQIQAQKKKAKKATGKNVATNQIITESPVLQPAIDTTPKMVTITSAFKPALQAAAKINFLAATPIIDSSKLAIIYQVPSQHLFFAYQPVSIKPLALQIDTVDSWKNDQYIKVGAGNFSSFLGEAAFSFGDGKHAMTNLKGNFLTATGNLPAQKASKIGVDVLSVLRGQTTNEWTTHAYYQSNTQYLYGYQPVTLPYQPETLLQRFNTIGIDIGLQNTIPNEYGITYHPQIQFLRFSNKLPDLAENSFTLSAPIRKTFSKFYAFNLGLFADISRMTLPLIPNPIELKNDLFFVHPAFELTTPNLFLHLGLQPTWDNTAFSALPSLTAEAHVNDHSLVIEAGWVGSFQKNTYHSLAGINPWIAPPTSLLNTKVIEQYAGIKGNSGSHFTYHLKLSYLSLTNQPLFVNDVNDGKTFLTLFEPDMKAFRLKVETGYTVSESVSLLAATAYTQYSSLTVNQQAWGLLPFELTGTLKWKVRKDLQLTTDVFVWDGNFYRDKTLKSFKADPVADINLGAEFTVMPRLNIWLQMNNVLNSTYQRWNNYPTLGFTVLGGVVYSFR